MADRLKGRVAIVSGGATGVGGAASRLFAAEGARVAVLDINRAAAEATAQAIVDAGGEAMVAVADVSQAAAVQRAVAAVVQRWGTVDVLFNRACHMFARAIAVEYRDRGIRCNAVCPGFIRTPHGLHEVDALQKLGVDVSDAALAIAQGRICEPEEVAAAALFLASDEASFINGTHLFVDNGFTAV